MLPMLRDNCDTVTLTKPTKLKKYDVVLTSMHWHVPKEDIFAVVTAFTKDNVTHKITDLNYKIYSRKCVAKKKLRWKYYSFKEKLYPYYRKIKRKWVFQLTRKKWIKLH